MLVPPAMSRDAIPLLAPHAGAVVLADVSDTPELLYKTDVRTVGSLYPSQRPRFPSPARGMARRADRDGAARNRRRRDFPCPRLPSLRFARRWLKTSIARRCRIEIRGGHPPPWLVQIGENPASGHVLYAVDRRGVAGAQAGSATRCAIVIRRAADQVAAETRMSALAAYKRERSVFIPRNIAVHARPVGGAKCCLG